MSTEELVRLAIFGGVVLAVMGSSVVILVQRLFGVVRRKARVIGRRRRITERVILLLAGVLVLCGIWAKCVEPYWIAVRTEVVQSDKFRAAAGPITIAHISDLHCDAVQRAEPAMIRAIRDAKPDQIVFTGDTVNSPAGVENFRAVMTELATIAPVIASVGNWDAAGIQNGTLYDGLDVTVLNRARVTRKLKGTNVEFLGVRNAGELDVLHPAGQSDPETYRVLLCHYPSVAPAASERGIDLQLSGHIHGGQIALPFYGAMVTLDAYGKRFEAGRYRVGEMDLNVSRGIGMEGGPAPRMRFCSRPTVTILVLKP
jgi:predicted MPP superfamily phosphohydrolase